METVGVIPANTLPRVPLADRQSARIDLPGFAPKTEANEREDIDSIIDAFIKRIQERNILHAQYTEINHTVSHPKQCPFGGNECDFCADGIRIKQNSEACVKNIYQVEECHAYVRYRELLKRSRLVGMRLEQTFEAAKIDANNKRLFNDLRKWDPLSGFGIYIAAKKDPNNPQGNGTGKTYAMCALMHRLCREGIACFMAGTIEFLNEVRTTYGEFALENEMLVLERYINVPVLFWDDLGKESIRPGSEWAAEKIYYVINERVIRRNPIVISSNFYIQELELRFGEYNHGPAIVSRLVEHCGDNIYELGGPDRRFGR